MGLDSDDVHFFFGKHFRNIAQQALAVYGLDGHIHRVDLAGRLGGAALAPLHLDHPVAAALHHVAQVGAIGAVHAHALAPGDKAADQVWRRGLAAFGQLRHQRVDAHHQHTALAAGRGAGFFEVDYVVGVGRGLGRTQQDFDIAQRKLVFADHLKQVIGRMKAQLRGQIVQLEGGFALALQQFFDRLAAFGDGLVQRQRVEVGPHLGASAVAHQKAQLQIEPVARGAAFFGSSDFYRLPVFERRVQRHQRAVHAGATAAVAQGGVHAVGKVHRRGAGG